MAKSSSNEKNTSQRLRFLALMAILAAMSMALGKFLQIPIGNSIRISFENLPIIFAGFVFGPLGGGAVAFVEDTVGGLIAFGEINPIITVGAVAVGVLSGLVSKMMSGREGGRYSFLCCVISVTLSHVVGSMIIKSFGLYVFYRTPLPVLLTRVPIYLAISAAEGVIIYTVLRSRGVRNALRPFVSLKK